MIGILKTNGMKLEPHGNERGIAGVALYPIYCLFNHSCTCNTNYVKFPDYHLELRSQKPIQRGEEISTRYISATIGKVKIWEKCSNFWGKCSNLGKIVQIWENCSNFWDNLHIFVRLFKYL